MKNHSIAILVLASAAGVASAQSDIPWDGVYVGFNAGGAGSRACNTWTQNGAPVDAATLPAFYNRSCSSGDALAAGLQIGDNFQYKHLFWGVGAEIDLWNGAKHTQSLKYTGAVPPPGAYAFSGKLHPSDFAIIGPRVGYANRQWLSYVRVGGMAALGSGNSTANYTPLGAVKPTASFDGGSNFASTGWAAGGGAEWGLNGPWSISVEYLHANLGKGSNSTAACTGTASACAVFPGISFDSVHTGFSANIFRIGINYWFSYWQP